MQPAKITRPKFPKGYVDKPVSFVDWDWVAAQLEESKHYWLCSVYPNGKPHVVPRWGVFLDGKVYYDGSPETRHALNIKRNPAVSVHLESGSQPIILYGISSPAGKPSSELGKRLSAAYKKKYKEMGYAPVSNSFYGGGLFVCTRHVGTTWISLIEALFKFLVDEE